jgi:hypothetical protein
MLHCSVLVSKLQYSEVGYTLYTSKAAPALKAHLQKECELLRPVGKSYVFYNVSVTLCRAKCLKFMSLGILGICVFIFPLIIQMWTLKCLQIGFSCDNY